MVPHTIGCRAGVLYLSVESGKSADEAFETCVFKCALQRNTLAVNNESFRKYVGKVSKIYTRLIRSSGDVEISYLFLSVGF